MESSASPQELNPCRAPVAILRPSWAMHHDNALPTVRRHNIFEFLSNKFKQSKAIYLYFFNSALSVYLRKSFFNHRQYNFYHRADARVSPRHQSLASCCSLGMPSAFDRSKQRSTRVAHIWPKDQSPSGVGRISYRDAPLEPPFHTAGAWLSDSRGLQT